MPTKSHPEPSSLSFDDYKSVLELLSTDDARPLIVIGGQAVNFWAQRYLSQRPALEQLQPFTSHDIDVLGHIDDAYRAAAEPNVELETPKKGSATPVIANLYITTGKTIRMVQFLRHMAGVSNDELLKFAVRFEFKNRAYHIADPIALLAAKVYNLVSLTQRGRNDEKHFEMLNVCVPTFLARQVHAVEKAEGPAKTLLQHFERVLSISLSSSGRKLARTRPVRWSTFLPLRQLQNSGNTQLQRFAEMRMARWAEGLIKKGLTP